MHVYAQIKFHLLFNYAKVKFKDPVFDAHIILQTFQDLTLAGKGHSSKYMFGKESIIFITSCK